MKSPRLKAASIGAVLVFLAGISGFTLFNQMRFVTSPYDDREIVVVSRDQWDELSERLKTLETTMAAQQTKLREDLEWIIVATDPANNVQPN